LDPDPSGTLAEGRNAVSWFLAAVWSGWCRVTPNPPDGAIPGLDMTALVRRHNAAAKALHAG